MVFSVIDYKYACQKTNSELAKSRIEFFPKTMAIYKYDSDFFGDYFGKENLV